MEDVMLALGGNVAVRGRYRPTGALGRSKVAPEREHLSMVGSESVSAVRRMDPEIKGARGRARALGSPTDPVQPTLEPPRPNGGGQMALATSWVRLRRWSERVEKLWARTMVS
ncbi:hypothetical protein M514_01270 [Trichuris suis]|uniref:Uncharacterized protein n=1 Tax=Trichuris suis TaxID=68888 RepID=A0A085MQ65_9BILA|nr:hypothetical protein M514_01270 [Trichuris suis]